MENEYGTNTDKVTVRNLLDTIKMYVNELLLKWWIILPGSILFAGLFYYWAHTDVPTYSTDLTFMVYEDEGVKMGGGLGSMLGSLGIGSEKVNLEKIMELSKSNKILFQTVFDTTEVNGKGDLVANHLIDLYDLNKVLQSKKPIRFNVNKVEKLDEEQRGMLSAIKDLLIGNAGILTTGYGVKSGIMKISISTLNEQLSIDFLIKHFNNLSSFYVNKSVAKETRTYNILQNKVSRLYAKMNNKDYEGAAFEDKTLGVWQQSERVQSKIYERDSRISGLLYAEAVKNLEIAEFSLQSKTPFIQEIDVPFSPLHPDKKSKLKYTLLGLIVGIFLFTVIICGKTYFKNI